MTDNHEMPNSGINSQNAASKNWAEALWLIQYNISKETSRAIEQKSSSSAFVRNRLSNEKQTFEYIESIWNQIKESPLFSKVIITDETLTRLAKNLRKEFLAQIAIFEKNRLDIEIQIRQEYDLSAEQLMAIREKISRISNQKLSAYRMASSRNQILWEVCRSRNEPMPFIHRVSRRLRDLFGSAADAFDTPTIQVILKAEKTWRMSRENLERIWNQLDEYGQTTLISLLSIDISLQSLHEIDAVIFSKETLKNNIRKDISQNIPQNIQDLLKTSGASDIEDILEDLEWSDISDVSLNGETVANLLKWSGSPFPKKLSAYFQKWLDNHTEVESLEKESRLRAMKKPNPNKNPDGSDVETVSKEWVDGFRNKLYQKHGSVTHGIELLLNSEFLNGTKKLIFSTIYPPHDDTFAQIETGADLQDGNEKTYWFYIVPLKADLTPDYHQRRYVSVSYFAELFDTPTYLSFEEESGFYNRVGKSVPSDEVSVEEIDQSPVENTESTSSENDQPESENENVWDGIPLENRLELASLTQSAAAENSGSGNEATVENPDDHPTTLSDFNKKASEKLGTVVNLSKWSCFSIGKPGTAGYYMYRIQKTDDSSMTVWGGSPAFPAEEISYADLYTHAILKDKGFSVLWNKLQSASELLKAMQSDSTQAETWKKLEISEDQDGNPIFDFIDRRFDKTKVKKQYFPGNDGHIVEIVSIENGIAQARIGEKFDKGPKGFEADWGETKDIPLQYVAQFMLRFSCVPWNEPPREISSRELPKDLELEKGTVKSIFGRLSVHDVMSGFKKFNEEFKHHLQHGNHLQEQRVMLGIAKQIGMDNWNSEWYADYKSQYENGEKNLIEERLKKLGEMATPLRHRSIRASLLNNGTHDYDHWTNALSMLEKHGNLYAGGLRDLEGTWMFFKRIAGIPLHDNVNKYEEFQIAVARIQNSGIDNVTEEAVIEAYMQTNPKFQNAQIWRMVKGRVKSGSESEASSGATEAEQFINLDQRLAYAMGKLRDKEYANGIWALEKIFEKEGPAWKKQSIAFMLAMSRIPERLPRPVLEKFIKIYDQWRLHSPALGFIKDRSSQEKFRDTIRTLVEIKKDRLVAAGKPDAGNRMQSDFDRMMKLIATNADVLKPESKSGTGSLQFDTDTFNSVENFWKKYGKEIQMELTMNTQGNILISESEIKKHPALENYKNSLANQLNDTNILNGEEESSGTVYMSGDTGAGVVSIKPEKTISKMGMQGHHGWFSTEPQEKAIQADFRLSMEEIRDKDNEEFDENDKRVWFKRIYIAYVEKITGSFDLEQFLKHKTVKPFSRLGLEPPPLVNRERSQRRIDSKKKEIRDLKSMDSQKKRELQFLQKGIKWDIWPTEDQKIIIDRLSNEIILNNQTIAEQEKILHKLEDDSIKYSKFEPENEEHKIHFEKQFQKFLKSGGTEEMSDEDSDSADKVQNHTSARVSRAMEARDANEVRSRYAVGESPNTLDPFSDAVNTDLSD